jgi:eukaryotic-like serine/threonine-protein kinase
MDDPAAAVQPEGTLAAGTVLEKRYEILSVQGVGGMGAVYRARDLRFSAVQKIIAVKEMNNGAPDPRIRRLGIESFEREANILASLSHPAIPKIFDYFSEGLRSYLVLEFIEGETLEDLMDQRRHPFEPEEVVQWGIDVCDVLAYLHSNKPPVIFRDIKPGNLMLRADGRLMVIDFGIAKVFEYGQRGTMIGTEGYSPPEQYRGVAEPRGDLYALAATMHHLITGRDPRLEPPFSFQERPIRLFNPRVSADLEAVITKCLAYDTPERYTSANEFASALSAAVPITLRGTGRLGTTAFTVPQDIKPAWIFRCEDDVRSSPRLTGEMLCVGSYDSNLYCLQASDGAFVWKSPTQGGIASTPCVHDDLILIGSEDGQMYAVSRRLGQKEWQCATGGSIRSSARVEYGHAFFGSDDGHVYALNAQQGRVVWKFQSAGPVRSTPLIVGEVIYIGSDDGYLYALDLRTGLMRWKQNAYRRVTSSPAIDQGRILVGSGDGHLYCFNAGSGWPVWRFRTKGPVYSSPVVVDGTVFIGSADGLLYALDAETGRERWKYDTGSPVTSSPAVSEGVVYIGSNDGTLHAIDAQKARNLWRYTTKGPIPSSPVVGEGLVYFGSVDHHVYALHT